VVENTAAMMITWRQSNVLPNDPLMSSEEPRAVIRSFGIRTVPAAASRFSRELVKSEWTIFLDVLVKKDDLPPAVVCTIICTFTYDYLWPHLLK
jgi:hypothetical protein